MIHALGGPALLAATAAGADLCGVGGRLGRIEAGYQFDAVLLDEDPADPAIFARPGCVTGVFRRGLPVVPHPRLADRTGPHHNDHYPIDFLPIFGHRLPAPRAADGGPGRTGRAGRTGARSWLTHGSRRRTSRSASRSRAAACCAPWTG